MKKSALLFFTLLISIGSFAQFNLDDYIRIKKNEINIRFGNRKEKGFYNIMQANLLMGNEVATQRLIVPYPYPTTSSYSIMPAYNSTVNKQELAVAPSFTLINGYMFNEHWAAGVGLGYEVFNHNLFPLFAEVRYTFWDTEISPFVAMKGGYAFGNFKMKHQDEIHVEWSPYHVTDAGLRHHGGLMLHPEIGVKVPLNAHSDLLISAAYRHQKTRSVIRKDYDTNQFDEWEHKEELNRISFGVGIMFR